MCLLQSSVTELDELGLSPKEVAVAVDLVVDAAAVAPNQSEKSRPFSGSSTSTNSKGPLSICFLIMSWSQSFNAKLAKFRV